MEQIAQLFNPAYWLKLLDPTRNPVGKDVYNLSMMFYFLANQEKYKVKGADFKKGDLKWQNYMSRIFRFYGIETLKEGTFLQGFEAGSAEKDTTSANKKWR